LRPPFARFYADVRAGVTSAAEGLPAVITVLAGGVGAARFLQGVLCHTRQRDLTVVSNTGDDLDFFGLYVSPDLDIVTYTLAGAIGPFGFGLLNDTQHVVGALAKFGHEPWFALGDRDLATALHRTRRFAEGASYVEVAAEICRAYGLDLTLLPMSNEPVRTRVQTPEGELAFQDYFVRRRAEPQVQGIAFAGIEQARPSAGVIAALRDAEAVLIAPSNPFVSIGPILALPDVRATLRARRETVVAVSPIVGGEALKGPAAAMMRSLGHDNSAVTVAALYRDIAGTLVIDDVDASLAPAVAAQGVRPIVMDTIMRSSYEKAALAAAALAAARAGN
jgi:LPPG:FO 2-phospho-L-lactate transferase